MSGNFSNTIYDRKDSIIIFYQILYDKMLSKYCPGFIFILNVKRYLYIKKKLLHEYDTGIQIIPFRIRQYKIHITLGTNKRIIG